MKVGDLVKIKDNTTDPDLPSRRIGIIIAGLEREEDCVAKILFSNGAILRFHKQFLIIVNEGKIKPND
jgi:hypothetical protein|tara:strand:+ start:496 stop:699 length:204 start_codon:yes stop_codon:yes gene_type:complete